MPRTRHRFVTTTSGSRTGIKRVVEGEIRNVVKGAESKLNVKYSTLPVPFETTYSVLDTDYDSYSVVWSCSSIGPLRARECPTR